MGRFALEAYAIWLGLPEADVRMWRDQGIVIPGCHTLGILDGLVTLSAPHCRPEPTVTPPRLLPKMVAHGGKASPQLIREPFRQNAARACRNSWPFNGPNLNELELQLAKFSIRKPLDLVNEHKDVKHRIEEIERELAQLGCD